MHRSRFWWMFGLLLLVAVPAAAQSKDDEAARQHFNSGRAYFDHAEYDDAVREFEAAYRLSGRPALLINISRAHESAGRPAEAAEAIERWQAVAPADDPLRSDMDTRLARLRAQVEKQAAEAKATEPQVAEPEAEPSASAPPPAESTHSRIGPWILIGSGGALAATGAVFVVLGRSDISKVEDPGKDTRWSDIKDEYDRGPRRVAIGTGLACVGAAALATGLIWYFRGGREEKAARANVDVGPLGLSVHGRF